MPDGPLRPSRGGLSLAIRLSPGARADRLGGVVRSADGGKALAAQVTAPPADGRANAALLKLLAQHWRLPRRDLSIVAGAASRHKLVHIAGDPARLLDRLSALVAAPPER